MGRRRGQEIETHTPLNLFGAVGVGEVGYLPLTKASVVGTGGCNQPASNYGVLQDTLL